MRRGNEKEEEGRFVQEQGRESTKTAVDRL